MLEIEVQELLHKIQDSDIHEMARLLSDVEKETVARLVGVMHKASVTMAEDYAAQKNTVIVMMLMKIGIDAYKRKGHEDGRNRAEDVLT